MLTLSEELLLLGVHDEKGSLIFVASSALPYGLAAALIEDLKEQNKIIIKDNDIILKDYSPTQFEFLDYALLKIKSKVKVKNIAFWIKTFALDGKSIKEKILDKLVKDNILQEEKQKFLWLIKFNRYPTLNPIPELETRDFIHKSVLMNITPDDKLKTLIALMYDCKLLNEVFPKENRSLAKKNILPMIKDLEISNELNEVLRQMAMVRATNTSTNTFNS